MKNLFAVGLLSLAALQGCGDKPTRPPSVVLYVPIVDARSNVASTPKWKCIPCPLIRCLPSDCPSGWVMVADSCEWPAGTDTVDVMIGTANLNPFQPVEIEYTEGFGESYFVEFGFGGPNLYPEDEERILGNGEPINVWVRFIFSWQAGSYGLRREHTRRSPNLIDIPCYGPNFTTRITDVTIRQ